VVHPVARLTFADAIEGYALHRKALSDKLIEVDSFHDYIAANDAGRGISHAEFPAYLVEYLQGEERDLPLVIFLIFEEAVVPDSFPCDTLNFLHLEDRTLPGLLAVMAEVVVFTGNEQIPDDD
jgi:hypothetical protein